MRRRVPTLVAVLVLTACVAVPLGFAARAWVAWRVDSPPELEIPPVPTVHERDFAAYDLSAVNAGDWVEFDVVVAGGTGEVGLLNIHLACVESSADTLWIEGEDVISARLYPGTSLLFEVDRASRLIRRAWWGTAGTAPLPAEVTRTVQPPGAGDGAPRRGGVEPDTLRVGEQSLACSKVTYEEGSQELGWIGRTTAWMSPDVPFPRRVSLSRADAEIAWEHGAAVNGGIVREIYRGLTVTTVTRLTAWGRDARRRMPAPVDAPGATGPAGK